MTSPSRRRVQRAAVITAAAVVSAAAGAAVAVHLSRRTAAARPEPRPPTGIPARSGGGVPARRTGRGLRPSGAPPDARPGNAGPDARPAGRDQRPRLGAPPAARRNWAGLIAVPAVAIAAGTVALVAARPTPAPETGPLVRPVPAASAPARSPDPGPVASQPACRMTGRWTPPLPTTSASGRPAVSAFDVGFPPCWVLVLGESVTLAGTNGELVEVTATRALDPRLEPSQQPRPDGRHRVSFRLHYESLDAGPPEVMLRSATWAADERTGWIYPVGPPGEEVRLAPDGEADQFVAFDVGADARLTRLRLSINSADNRGIVEWVIG